MKNLILALIIMASFTACELVELEQPSNATVQKQEQIADSKIEITSEVEAMSVLTDNSKQSWMSVDFTLGGSDAMTTCRLDDQMIFRSDGTYTYNSGGQLCGAEDSQRQRVGTWELNFDQLKMIFDESTPDEYSADIIGFSNNELRLKGSYFNLEVRGKYIIQ